MARRTAAKPRPREPLSRQRALKAGIALADADGIGSLTMRKLAQEFGVEAMSLYHHVRNKDDILDGMVDVVFGEIDLPPAITDWQEAMRQRAHSARRALSRHPWAIGLMESRTAPGPATLRHHDACIGCLLTAGFPIAMAAHAISVLDSYIYGFVLQEINLPFSSTEETHEVAASILDQMPAEDYPNLVALTTQHVLQPDYDYANEFAFGLDLILDGLERSVQDEEP